MTSRLSYTASSDPQPIESLDSLTRSDMLRKMGKDANAHIESQVMEVDTLREAGVCYRAAYQ